MHWMLGGVHGVAGIGIQQKKVAINAQVAQRKWCDAQQQDDHRHPYCCQRAAKPPGTPTGEQQPQEQNRRPRQNRLAEQRGCAKAQPQSQRSPRHPRPVGLCQPGVECQRTLQRPQHDADKKGLGLHHGAVKDEVGIDGGQQRSQQRKGLLPVRLGENAPCQPVGQPWHQQPTDKGLQQAQDQRVRAGGGEDRGHEPSIEK